jgi:hypothetical protein
MTALQDQRGDVQLFQDTDDGNIICDGGIVQMTGGFETAIYLSMFGGNEEDHGDDATQNLQWWGNYTETDPALKYRSETQRLLNTLATNSANLRLIEAAVLRDLDWMKDSVSDLTASIRITRPNYVEGEINYEAFGKREQFKFAANWEAMRQ